MQTLMFVGCEFDFVLVLFVQSTFTSSNLFNLCSDELVPQDDLCIQLSKNIEPEERKTVQPPLVQPPLAVATAAAVAVPSPTLLSSAVPPPSSAVPASSQPSTAAGSPAVGSVGAAPAAPANP